MGTAFGGGIAMTGDTCGVVTGAILIIGLKYGACIANDRDAKNRAYQNADMFIQQFRSRNKSTRCRELLGFDIKSDNHPNKDDIISQRCPGFVEVAAEILEEILRSDDDKAKN